jgi:hypothetical protein
MKQCPTCNQTYDDTLSFCLMDGTPLTTEGEEKTVVMQRPAARRKSKFLLWLGLFGLIILAGSGVVIGLVFYNFSKQSDNAQGKRQPRVNLPSSPASPPAAKVTKTPAAAKSPPSAESSAEIDESESSAKIDESESTPSDKEDTEDITPIAWDTTAAGFKGEAGQTYTFRCPEEGTEQGVYGSDIYTQDSSICTAAVHAGIITLAQGGVVTIEYRPGRATYGSTVRNGIKSRTWGEYPRSFVVR